MNIRKSVNKIPCKREAGSADAHSESTGKKTVWVQMRAFLQVSCDTCGKALTLSGSLFLGRAPCALLRRHLSGNGFQPGGWRSGVATRPSSGCGQEAKRTPERPILHALSPLLTAGRGGTPRPRPQREGVRVSYSLLSESRPLIGNPCFLLYVRKELNFY